MPLVHPEGLFGFGVGLGKEEILPGWKIFHCSYGSLKSRDPVHVSPGGPSGYRNFFFLLWNTGKKNTALFQMPYPEPLTIPPPLPATYHLPSPPCCQSKGIEESILDDLIWRAQQDD